MKKFFIKTLMILITILVIIYLAGTFFYENRYFPNTYINTINVSHNTEKEIEEILLKEENKIHITIIAEEVKPESIFGKDINYEAKISENFYEIMKNQNKYFWFLNLFKNKEYEVDFETTYDKSLLKEKILELKCVINENKKEAIDAYIKKDKSGYRIIPEEKGTIVKTEELYEKVIECIENGTNQINLRKENLYEKPLITKESTELLQELKDYKEMSNFIITYDFEDRQEVIDYKIYNEWISLSENKEIIVNEDKVGEYVKQLASKYDTLGTTVPFQTTNLGIKELKCEQYGWKINKSETKKQLIEALKNKETVKIEPVYTKKSISRSENFISNTYIEVSLEEQMMWLYKEGKCIVETPVVTGLPTTARATTPGIYSLVSKETDRYLGTYENQGYRTHVNFWMPFNGGQGIHDATWRTDEEFGGTTYKTNGSHGCVNTPLDKVEEIFKNIKTGYAVIVH